MDLKPEGSPLEALDLYAMTWEQRFWACWQALVEMEVRAEDLNALLIGRLGRKPGRKATRCISIYNEIVRVRQPEEKKMPQLNAQRYLKKRELYT
jgi:hypothetical protein